ncbi:ribose-phosphate pyrophosphokinase [Chloropicon primus]|uniref:ribose-phosphate diphosphokinase n=1 Tax=Chloropicon primus TaxID=1764295 RepID=A0A5B8MB23_9CHLO|nr:ribose-phosphate pyrophosphokinase [Chloropicon primus]UPQ96874.1 ribose-phosphate pyrophosphokinase [Chloropicon primus]|mmetsp:Transcript_13665/g.38484  ORF Transcript_13665/g.38484 Transcript_13665/m.38484 type:complete len:402 (+) Transcript_13665:212-1417(+)|eukprot:QDZ17658.1 ribose-phosphate pyrophosphokinase [Chloropicon primus]
MWSKSGLCRRKVAGSSSRVEGARRGLVRARALHNNKYVSSLGPQRRPKINAVSYSGNKVNGAGSLGSASDLSESETPSIAGLTNPSLGGPLKIFSGSVNEPLAQEVANYLGMELGNITIKKFADGETYVQLQESIRGCDVFLIQSTSPPTNDTLMELLVMIDACKRASARNITAVIPYFGYARADRKASGREAITAKLVANLLTEAGADRVLALDLHSLQCVGYFDIPVDHVFGQPVLLEYLASKDMGDDLVVVSPDVGGVARARAFAKLLNDAPLAIIDKRRASHNVAEVMNIIGDVKGKMCVMVDDMIDTAGTITKGAEVLVDQGAKGVIACATHPVFSGPAIERLSSGVFDEVIVTNSIPPMHMRGEFPQLTVLSVASLLGESIWRVHNSSSINALGM